jgi:hypothetical protein
MRRVDHDEKRNEDMENVEKNLNGLALEPLPTRDAPRALVGRPAPDFTMASTKNIQTLDEP